MVATHLLGVGLLRLLSLLLRFRNSGRGRGDSLAVLRLLLLRELLLLVLAQAGGRVVRTGRGLLLGSRALLRAAGGQRHRIRQVLENQRIARNRAERTKNREQDKTTHGLGCSSIS